ncbi:hypothetical protein [Chitinimonas sp.]|uniref:hypothetical protein n=1 Tax=Chitinimonas sp. TaxID=1934313 RepID=UPI0035AF9D40
MKNRLKNRLLIASIPVAAVAAGLVLHGRAAALAAVALGTALLLTSAVLMISARRDRH